MAHTHSERARLLFTMVRMKPVIIPVMGTGEEGGTVTPTTSSQDSNKGG